MYKIFCEIDGILTDFDQQVKNSYFLSPKDYIEKNGEKKFWEDIDKLGLEFWERMEWAPQGLELWDVLKNTNIEILSSPYQSETSRIGKRNWVRFNICGTRLNMCHSTRKWYFSEPYAILIDKEESIIKEWEERGGIGILFESTSQVLEKLHSFKII